MATALRGITHMRARGGYVATEEWTLGYSRRTKPGNDLVVYAPGSGSTSTVITQSAYRRLPDGVADAGFCVGCPDMGQATNGTWTGGTFGNQLSEDRLDLFTDYVQGPTLAMHASPGPICGIGGSGGATAILLDAYYNPGKYVALVLINPLTDIIALHANPIFTNQINNAYGGEAAYLAAMQTRNPIDLDPAGWPMPMIIYQADDDEAIDPDITGQFAGQVDAANGDVTFELVSTGMGGHLDDDAVIADVVDLFMGVLS